MDILPALNWRYATKTFDSTKKVSDADLNTILESGRLAPSSFGIEAWKFLVINSADIRNWLKPVCFNQPAITNASHLIVLCRRINNRETLADETVARIAQAQGIDPSALSSYRDMLAGAVNGRTDFELDAWLKTQVYIPLGMMLETAALLQIDACPMEGFDPKAVDELLNLPAQNLASTVLMTVGYRGADPSASRPKARRKLEDVVEFRR